MKKSMTLCLIMFAAIICCYRIARGETTNLNLNEIPGTITIPENTDKLVLKRGSIQFNFKKIKSLKNEKYYITDRNGPLNSWTANGNGPYPQEAYSAALYAVDSKDIEEDSKNGTIKFVVNSRLQTSVLPGNPYVRSVSSDIVGNCSITISGIQFLEEEELINGQVVSYTGANIPPKETIWYVNQLTVLEKYPEKPPISYFGTSPENLAEVIKIKEPSAPQAAENPSGLKISKHGNVLTVVKGGNKADFDIGAPLSELYRSAGLFLSGKSDSEMYIANVWGIPASEMPQDLEFKERNFKNVQMLYLVTSDAEIIKNIQDIKDTGVWFGGIKITGNIIIPHKGSRIAWNDKISNGKWTVNNIPWHYIYVTGVENVFKEEEHNAEENENIVYKQYDKNTPEVTKQPGAPPYGDSFKDSVTGMEFVFVRGGIYTMGVSAKYLEKFNSYYQNKSTSSVGIGNRFSDDKSNNKHFVKVKIKVPDFYISKYETTQPQWVKIMKTNPSSNQNMDCPVEMVSWYDAQKFIKKLNELTGRKYCLPTEYEWEYAAGSGGKDENWSGTSDGNSLAEYAWFLDNSGFKTHPVGTKKPNGLGICDMTGNVAEYCSNIDSYFGTPEDILAKLSNYDMMKIMAKYCVEHFSDIVISYLNPRYNPKSGKPDFTYLGRPDFVIRGGSFNSTINGALIGYRNYSYYGNGADDCVGFRVILPMSREFVEYEYDK